MTEREHGEDRDYPDGSVGRYVRERWGAAPTRPARAARPYVQQVEPPAPRPAPENDSPNEDSTGGGDAWAYQPDNAWLPRSAPRSAPAAVHTPPADGDEGEDALPGRAPGRNGGTETDPTQIHPTQIHPTQIHPTQIHPTQIHPTQAETAAAQRHDPFAGVEYGAVTWASADPDHEGADATTVSAEQASAAGAGFMPNGETPRVGAAGVPPRPGRPRGGPGARWPDATGPADRPGSGPLAGVAGAEAASGAGIAGASGRSPGTVGRSAGAGTTTGPRLRHPSAPDLPDASEDGGLRAVANPQPANPQPANPQPGSPQPANPQPTNTQAANPRQGGRRSATTGPFLAPADAPVMGSRAPHDGSPRSPSRPAAARDTAHWTDPIAIAAQEAQRARSPERPERPEHSERTDLSSARLLRNTKRPPQSGWRRMIYVVSGRMINPGESPTDIRRRELTLRVNQPLLGCYKIAMLSLKGGVGKTTMTATLGATFASLRGDRVVAVDANPDRGTLSQKIPLETSATVRNLLRDAQRVRRYTDVRAYTSQGPSRLEVLASEQDPAVSEAYSEEDYRRTVNLLEHFYNIVLTDCGTGLMHSAMYGVLGVADQLVIVSSGSIDGARSASATMDWLDAHGHGELVANSVVVINFVHRSRGGVDLDRVSEHFAARCRAVVRIPFDGHLEEGAEIDLDRLEPHTRMALLELAANVADAFDRVHAL